MQTYKLKVDYANEILKKANKDRATLGEIEKALSYIRELQSADKMDMFGKPNDRLIIPFLYNARDRLNDKR